MDATIYNYINIYIYIYIRVALAPFAGFGFIKCHLLVFIVPLGVSLATFGAAPVPPSAATICVARPLSRPRNPIGVYLGADIELLMLQEKGVSNTPLLAHTFFHIAELG